MSDHAEEYTRSGCEKRSLDVRCLIPALDQGGWRASLRTTLNGLFGVSKVYQLFERAVLSGDPKTKHAHDNIFLAVLRKNEMTMDYADFAQQLPQKGPCIVVANHAFGGADALALSGICVQLRSDTRILANAMTAELPGISEWTIPLQILGEDGATHTNRLAMKKAMEVLWSGGLLVVFPAGAVSRWQAELGRVADPKWSDHVARLAVNSSATVIPVRFFGRNPAWFELLGRIHPVLYSALILRVFLAARAQRIKFRAGNRIETDNLRKLESVQDITFALRQAVESIKEDQ